MSKTFVVVAGNFSNPDVARRMCAVISDATRCGIGTAVTVGEVSDDGSFTTERIAELEAALRKVDDRLQDVYGTACDAEIDIIRDAISVALKDVAARAAPEKVTK